jgi:outer membrane biosynthesis protein TonB
MFHPTTPRTWRKFLLGSALCAALFGGVLYASHSVRALPAVLTITPSVAATATPTPNATLQAKQAAQTAQADSRTATAASRNTQQAQTAQAKQVTQTAQADSRTATAASRNTQQAQTAQAKQVTQTAQADNRTATAASRNTQQAQTAQAKQATQTAQAEAVAATRTQQADNRTATQAAVQATATFWAEYTDIPYRELRDYPDDHIGEKVCVRGRVWNIVNHYELAIYLAGTYNIVDVIFVEPFDGIYENNIIRVCGTVAGKHLFSLAVNRLEEGFLRK